MFDKLFSQNRILETAMQASQFKNEAILNNLANVDTPGYKRKNVYFEGVLSNAIDKQEKTGVYSMDKVLSNLKITSDDYSVRTDGNSVNVETEMVEFYKNSTKYDAIVNSVLSNSNITNSVLSTFK